MGAIDTDLRTMLDAATSAPASDLSDLIARVEALEDADRARLERKNKLSIIAWGGDLDRIWPTLILSTTAAASGMEASVFFTFWGLFAIVKPGVRITGENWMQKMMSVMNPGSAQKAKLSRYHFAGAGPRCSSTSPTSIRCRSRPSCWIWLGRATSG